MRFFKSQLVLFLTQGPGRRNLRELARIIGFLTLLALFYGAVFQFMMRYEGRAFSFFEGLYWTLVTMSTLGYGDIVFHSTPGRAFSMVVIMSGMFSLLMVLPFTIVKLFYEPWMAAQQEARAPKELPEETRGHVILTNFDPVTSALIQKLKQYGYPYVLLLNETEQAVKLQDLGFQVVVGESDHPNTYRKIRLEKAALVAATANDMANTNIAFTVRELSDQVPIIATANTPASVDILKLAGSSHVVQLGEMMGQSLARRTIGADARAHLIGRFDKLIIAEATAAGTPLVGKTLEQSRLRELVGITVVGMWERGKFQAPKPESRITPNTVLVLAGSQEQIRKYDELFCIYHVASGFVVIIGGGRVGRATGKALVEREIDYRIVEQRSERILNREKYILGNAAELDTLERAGIHEAPTVILTTHEDDTNIYLTIFCRRLRPDIQIISRSTLERNVSTLHRAGADFVMSYSSMGASTIFNMLKRGGILMVAEGLNVFRVGISPRMAGKPLAASAIREETGCSIIAVQSGDRFDINPDPAKPLPRQGELIVIGDVEAEIRFLQKYAVQPIL